MSIDKDLRVDHSNRKFETDVVNEHYSASAKLDRLKARYQQ